MLFITKNKNKIKEASEILQIPINQGNFELSEIQDIDVEKVVLDKAMQVKQDCIVEDSALYLGEEKEIGALIKFFSNKRIVKAYEGESATAVCAIAYRKNDRISIFAGETKGTIVKERGKNGFGWDSVFMPEGQNKTFAEMTSQEKNALSQRRRAFDILKTQIK